MRMNLSGLLSLFNRSHGVMRRLKNSDHSVAPKIRKSGGKPKSRVKLLALVRTCPGGSHGWFAIRGGSGLVRKPFKAKTILWQSEQRQRG
jgi:hypothetical protein